MIFPYFPICSHDFSMIFPWFSVKPPSFHGKFAVAPSLPWRAAVPSRPPSSWTRWRLPHHLLETKKWHIYAEICFKSMCTMYIYIYICMYIALSLSICLPTYLSIYLVKSNISPAWKKTIFGMIPLTNHDSSEVEVTIITQITCTGPKFEVTSRYLGGLVPHWLVVSTQNYQLIVMKAKTYSNIYALISNAAK